jgi:predicted transcriptional regulator
MNINDRIKYLIDSLTKGKQRPFARSINIPISTLRDIIGPRQSEPSFGTLKKIIDSYPEVNLNWLMNGTGKPLLKDEAENEDFVLEEGNKYKANLKNTEISERVSLMIQKLSLNPNSFAAGLGYKRSQTIYDIINGKSAPSYDFFHRFMLSPYARQINIDWLLTGRGKMEA